MPELNFNTWVRKNWFTVVGIIIILSIVWYEQITIESRLQGAVNECNNHWFNAVKRTCPALSSSYNLHLFDSNISLEE